MIRGVLEQGVFRPLDPLPANWEEGQEVIVQEADHRVSDDPADVELDALRGMSEDDTQALLAALDEQNRLSKDRMRVPSEREKQRIRREFDELEAMAQQYGMDEDEYRQFQARLAEADAIAKEQMRREMGLP